MKDKYDILVDKTQRLAKIAMILGLVSIALGVAATLWGIL